MSSSGEPVEIFILNYNGSVYLDDCLKALERMGDGGYAVTVNVVDNGSIDSSEEIVKRFPRVNWIPLGRNLGFSAGNNAGVRVRREALASQGKKALAYVFLNNDTCVHPEWLTTAMRNFGSDPKIGLVGSKALFMDDFAVVRLTATNALPMHGGLMRARLAKDPKRTNIHPIFERSRCESISHLMEGVHYIHFPATLWLAARDKRESASITLPLEICGDEEQLTVEAWGGADDRRLGCIDLVREQKGVLELGLRPEDFVPVIQNAGNYVNEAWMSGDRGYREPDRGQCEARTDVDAVCGVSMFIRAELFEALGGFDEQFFAYYEDVDLSLRARLKGYRCVYEPTSVLRHVHGGSGGGEASAYSLLQVCYSSAVFASKYMGEEQWLAYEERLKGDAMRQFDQYLIDHQLDYKPQLRTSLRMIKRFWTFKGNRRFSRQAQGLRMQGAA